MSYLGQHQTLVTFKMENLQSMPVKTSMIGMFPDALNLESIAEHCLHIRQWTPNLVHREHTYHQCFDRHALQVFHFLFSI